MRGLMTNPTPRCAVSAVNGRSRADCKRIARSGYRKFVLSDPRGFRRPPAAAGFQDESAYGGAELSWADLRRGKIAPQIGKRSLGSLCTRQSLQNKRAPNAFDEDLVDDLHISPRTAISQPQAA
jgi:hypothetical protein